MNLTQQKLTKSEWDFLELPINKKEKYILKFIHKAYKQTSLTENPNNSLISYLKINVEDYEDFHKYFYNKYYEDVIHKLVKDYNLKYKLKINIKKLNIKKIYAEVLKDNNRSRLFFENNNFKKINYPKEFQFLFNKKNCIYLKSI